jgi:hypothetical protein
MDREAVKVKFGLSVAVGVMKCTTLESVNGAKALAKK